MNEALFMQRCMELASLAKGYSQSNPMVGALLVHEGRIISSGGHRKLGGEHAEVHCLNQVPADQREKISQSTLYVNLEPCAHFGRTPPCADRILEEKIPRVVIANLDPFEKVNGAGIHRLRQAGMEVRLGVESDRGRWLNRRFFCLHEQKRPYIILKWAESDQGFMAPHQGSRYPLTSTAAQWLNHKWRTEEAAIMVGFQTAQLDNPRLTPRHYPGRAPIRICLDPKGELDSQLHLIQDGKPSWIFTSQFAENQESVRFIEIPNGEQPISFILSTLHKELIPSLLVEGGAKTLETFFRLGLWDEVRVLRSPNSLSKGVVSPKIQDGEKIIDLAIGPDRLQVFTHKNSPYPYVDAMEL